MTAYRARREIEIYSSVKIDSDNEKLEVMEKMVKTLKFSFTEVETVSNMLHRLHDRFTCTVGAESPLASELLAVPARKDYWKTEF